MKSSNNNEASRKRTRKSVTAQMTLTQCVRNAQDDINEDTTNDNDDPAVAFDSGGDVANPIVLDIEASHIEFDSIPDLPIEEMEETLKQADEISKRRSSMGILQRTNSSTETDMTASSGEVSRRKISICDVQQATKGDLSQGSQKSVTEETTTTGTDASSSQESSPSFSQSAENILPDDAFVDAFHDPIDAKATSQSSPVAFHHGDRLGFDGMEEIENGVKEMMSQSEEDFDFDNRPIDNDNMYIDEESRILCLLGKSSDCKDKDDASCIGPYTSEDEDDNLSAGDIDDEDETGLDLNDEDFEAFVAPLSQFPHDQEAAHQRTHDNRMELSQRYESYKMLDDPSSPNKSSPPKKRFKDSSSKQTKITDFPGGSGDQPSLRSTEDRVYFRSSLSDTIFDRGETYNLSKLLKPQDLEKFGKYMITVDKFILVSGMKWAAQYSTIDGIFVDISQTILGERQTRKLMESQLWQMIDERDRGRARQINDVKLPMVTDGRGHEKPAILVSLLNGRRFPRPDPPLFYTSFGKTTIKQAREAFLFHRPEDWRRREYNGKIRVLDLFCGVGGMACGLEKVRRDGYPDETLFETKYAVEKDSKIASIFQVNFPGAEVYNETVDQFLENVENGVPGYPKPGAVDHIHASPPCQGFSDANRTGGKKDLANNKQIFGIIRAARALRPVSAVLENVTGLLQKNSRKDNRKYVQNLMRMFLEIGYQIAPDVLRACDYGDPQLRPRVVIFIVRIDHRLPDCPIPSHGEGKIPYVTSRQALDDLKHVTPAEGTERVANGTIPVMNHQRDRRGRPKNPRDHYKLEADHPARTLLRWNYIEHYDLERWITLRERARLMGFPDSFKFFGSFTDICGMIGNAVPVNFAEAIGKAIFESYNYELEPWARKDGPFYDMAREEQSSEPFRSCVLNATWSQSIPTQ